MTVIQENLSLPAKDGYQLSATLFTAEIPSSHFVLINSATAVPRQFYKNYAEFLVQEGFSVLTYDYRGIGGSRPANLRGFTARMRDWALQDMAGMVDWLRSEKCPDKIFMIGHSFGGQAAGLMDNIDNIDGMLTVSAQSGHWRLQGGEQKWMVLLHSWVTLPVTSFLLGYMPWSWFGAEDLPGKVSSEWAGWCRHRDYILGDKTLPLDRYNNFDIPVLAYSIDDDKWGTEKSVDAMMKAYPNMERRHIVPQTEGISSLGHFGYFRAKSEPLWKEAVSWLKGLQAVS
ncbi:alpha/beta fold hydrolase [Sneathiella sp.]|jgi:predicted alpha/beta hydrolase|uniref:alpha/beta hydrolase family protein n=1 Tax=Sneathiella sp. TaxID=1964365 RepID=UPI0039E217E6